MRQNVAACSPFRGVYPSSVTVKARGPSAIRKLFDVRLCR
jgi:ribosomal protein S12